MCVRILAPLLAAVICVGWLPAASAAPKLTDKEAAEREKTVKAFVSKVIVAFGKKDVDSLVELSEVPFNHQVGGFLKDKEGIREALRKGLSGKSTNAGKHEVKRIQTFKEASVSLEEIYIKDFKQVLTEDDLVVLVEVQLPDGKVEVRLLTKLLDGKPRLVGFGDGD